MPIPQGNCTDCILYEECTKPDYVFSCQDYKSKKYTIEELRAIEKELIEAKEAIENKEMDDIITKISNYLEPIAPELLIDFFKLINYYEERIEIK